MEMPYYHAYLQKGGLLLLSGFYETDIPDLLVRAEKEGLTKVSYTVHETWATLLLQKS